MSHPLNASQIATLTAAADSGMLPVTLRMLSELRWLEYLGLMRIGAAGRYVLTDAGRGHLRLLNGDARRAS